jgi:hypothetical protein
MSVALEHIMLAALQPGAEIVIAVKREGAGMRLRAELVTRGTDRSGMRTGESRHTLSEQTCPERQVLDELSRWVTANLADAMMRSP